MCLDTSVGASVALVDTDEATPLASGGFDDPRAHSERLAECVREVVADAGYSRLADAGLDRVVVGTGPAPFTGLRAGLVTARTLAWALGIDVVGIASIDALGRAALDLVDPDRTVVVATDARRKEVYAAAYRAAGANDVARVWGPVVEAPGVLARSIGVDDLVAGPGAALYPAELPPAMSEPGRVEAATLARIAYARERAGAAPADLGTEPLYLRGADIHPGHRR
nr:tRNA (adenosine(37)-N6)-threonylcarbamoyltransferase complex dimerization subunit type 1 TsaB [Nanchangia anserum]